MQASSTDNGSNTTPRARENDTQSGRGPTLVESIVVAGSALLVLVDSAGAESVCARLVRTVVKARPDGEARVMPLG